MAASSSSSQPRHTDFSDEITFTSFQSDQPTIDMETRKALHKCDPDWLNNLQNKVNVICMCKNDGFFYTAEVYQIERDNNGVLISIGIEYEGFKDEIQTFTYEEVLDHILPLDLCNLEYAFKFNEELTALNKKLRLQKINQYRRSQNLPLLAPIKEYIELVASEFPDAILASSTHKRDRKRKADEPIVKVDVSWNLRSRKPDISDEI